MEEKLSEFRRRRRREEIWNTLMLKGVMDKIRSSPGAPAASELASSPPTAQQTANLDLQRSDSNISIASSTSSLDNDKSTAPVPMDRLTLATYCLYALLWATVFLIAIQLRFGAVYLVSSGIVAIYLNTRTRPRRDGEVSAYSVFNPNCEAIDGTLKAEQFEREFNLIHHSP